MINEFLDIYEAGLRDSRASLTMTEAIHRIVEKTNLLIRHFNLLEDNVNESIKDFTDKIEYYLNNGMVDEVCKKLDEFAKDGTLDVIINDHVFGEIKSQIQDIKTDIANFKQTYTDNKTETDNTIQANAISINNNATKIKQNADEISRINAWVGTVEDKVGVIQNDYTNIQVKYPDSQGLVQKFILEDNKMAGVRKKYIHCMLTAKQWKEAWQDISAGTNNNNGSIWVPFYWAVDKDKVIDATMTLRDLNKWVWQSLGYSKIGIYGIGYINANGCYVYIENKKPDEGTIGVSFTICITELYK